MTNTNKFFSTESQLHYCIKLFLIRLDIDVDNKLLDYLFTIQNESDDPNFIRNQLLKLGIATDCQIYEPNQILNPSLYPCLVYSNEHSWLVGSVDNNGEVEFVNSNNRIDNELFNYRRLIISLVQNESRNRSNNILQVIYTSFYEEFKELLFISLLISALTFIVPFYIRILLGVVIPSESITSLILLAIGAIGLLFTFYQLGMQRSKKLASIVARLEYQISSKVFAKFLTLKYKDISLDYASKLERMNQNNSQMMNYIRDELSVALLDMPFLIIYLITIYIFVGNIVLVPLFTLIISTIFIYLSSIHYTAIANVRLRLQNDLAQCAQEIVRLLDNIAATNTSWIWLSRLKGFSAESAQNTININNQKISTQTFLQISTQMMAILTIYFGAQSVMNGGGDINSSLNLLVAIFLVWRLGGSFRFIMRALLKFNSSKERYEHLQTFLMETSENNCDKNENHRYFKINGFVQASNHRIYVKNKSRLNSFGFNGKAVPGELTIITSNEISTSSDVLKSLALLYEQTPGTLYFDGYDAMSLSRTQLNKTISYVNDKPLFPNKPIYDTLNELACKSSEFDLNELLSKLELTKWISNHDSSFTIDANIQTLQISKFPKKILFLLSFVEAFSGDSSIILLDDPTQGMCEHFFSNFIEVLREILVRNKEMKSRTIIIGTRNKTLLKMADSLIIIKRNFQCLQGSPEDLLSRAK